LQAQGPKFKAQFYQKKKKKKERKDIRGIGGMWESGVII
jgi:hypothetical protein